jgi:outer membrane protein, heavy metal efflux system
VIHALLLLPSLLLAADAVANPAGPPGPTAPAAPAASEGLSLEDLTNQIRAHNPSTAAAQSRVEAALLAVPRARALPEPFVTAMVEDVALRAGGGMPMYRFSVTQMFPWFGKRDRMAAVAAREAEARSARSEVTTLDVVASGKRLFFQLVLNRESRRINREQRTVVDTVVKIALARLGSGTGMHHDVLKMQTEATMLDDALIMLEADRSEMAAMLNALLDRPAHAQVAEPNPVWTDEQPLARDQITRLALERRPELREMLAMERAERAMAAAAQREYYPDVMLGALYDLRMDEADAAGAMIGINLPLWIGSRQRLDVRAADTRARGIERDRAAMAAMARAEIAQQLVRVDTSVRRRQLLEAEFIPRAQQTFDSAIAAFPAGTVDALALLDDLRALSTQRLARTATRVDRELALIDLERATGVPLREILR